MHYRFFLTVSRNNCCALAFGFDIIARNLARVEVRSGNTHAEGHTCAA
jgi:hypothetical protein